MESHVGAEEKPFLTVLHIGGTLCVFAWSFSADFDGKESELNHEPSGHLGQGGRWSLT